MSVLEVLGAPWHVVGAAVLGTLGIYAAVIALTRLSGLRTFAKMSTFDFAATIATGSILASVAVTSAPLGVGAVAIATLLAAQWLVARLRRADRASATLDNTPIVLMDGPRVLDDNLRSAGVTRADLRAKLREANVLRLAEVRCVVFETTGDVSVLHGPPAGPPLDDELLAGVSRGRGTDPQS